MACTDKKDISFVVNYFFPEADNHFSYCLTNWLTYDMKEIPHSVQDMEIGLIINIRAYTKFLTTGSIK